MTERELGEALIPQRGAARMVVAVLEAGTDSAVCRGRVPADSAFVTGGRAPAVVVLELAAQAAAVQQALAAPSGGAARPGYLVVLRDATLHADEVAADAPLVATVRRTGQAGPLATYEVAVHGADGAAIATATLSTHAGG